jgi:hypothetical protein
MLYLIECFVCLCIYITPNIQIIQVLFDFFLIFYVFLSFRMFSLNFLNVCIIIAIDYNLNNTSYLFFHSKSICQLPLA